MSDEGNGFVDGFEAARIAADRSFRMEAERRRWAELWAVTVEGEAEARLITAKTAADAKAKVEGFLRLKRVRGVRPAPITGDDWAAIDGSDPRDRRGPGPAERCPIGGEFAEGDLDNEPSGLDAVIGAFKAIGGRWW